MRGAMRLRVIASAGLRDRGGHAAFDGAHEDLLWHAVRESGVR
jgi:hypothetical protein